MKEININNFEEKLYYEKLDNGLEVFLLPMLQKKNYYCLFGTKYGGRNLKFKINDEVHVVPSGIAHFLEHKLFERDDISPFEFYIQTGTDVNASTTSEYTNYYFLGNNAFLDNLKYLLNWITHFSVTSDKVLKEQGIILSEANMYKDYPDRVLYERILNNVYVSDTRKEKVIGTDDAIMKITKEDLEMCYNAFYRPDNMYIIAVGCFDVDDTINLIKEQLKDFKNSDDKITVIEADEVDNVAVCYEEIKMAVETPKVAISFKVNKNKFKNLNIDKYFLDYYLHMILTLGFGTTSDFREYLLNEGIINTFSTQLTDSHSHYFIDFYATTNKPDDFCNEILKYIKEIKFDEDSFRRIKKLWVSAEVKMIDSINSVVFNILDDILDYGEFKNNKIDDIKSLDFNVLKDVYGALDFENKAILKILKDN